eukprot:5143977-Lingulodinium_polyedra.AAC.1
MSPTPTKPNGAGRIALVWSAAVWPELPRTGFRRSCIAMSGLIWPGLLCAAGAKRAPSNVAR